MAKALILGSTGLTGGFVLEKALKDDYFEKVTVLTRSPLSGVSHPKLEVIITDFKPIPEVEADIVFSCLGTTLKKTPDPEVYKFIEIGIPVNVAKKLLNKGLTQFHYVSSLGPSEKSSTPYLKNKWEAEKSLSTLSIPSVYLYRPSLIFGDRKEKRTAEDFSNSLFKFLDKIMIGKLKKFRRIHAATIAEAMIVNAKNAKPGNHIIESDKIQEIGKGLTN